MGKLSDVSKVGVAELRLNVRAPHIYSDYDPPPDKGIDCSVLPSMTQQHFAADCDINNILARFQETGVADLSLIGRHGCFADVASAVDYHEAQNLIAQAKEVFLDLPFKVRERFGNDPGRFLDFVDHLDDPDNLAEARKLGLLKPQEPSSDKAAADAAAAGPSGSPRAAAASPEVSPKGS